MNNEVKDLMLVGQVREALNEMAHMLGCDPQLMLPQDALIQWNNLEVEYDKFYLLPLQERLYRSGLATPSNNKDKS